MTEPAKPGGQGLSLQLLLMLLLAALVGGIPCFWLGTQARPRSTAGSASRAEEEAEAEAEETLLPSAPPQAAAGSAAPPPPAEPSAAAALPPPTLTSARERADAVRKRALCVGFLCVQYAAYALLRRYATGILKEDWSFSSVLGAGEALKFGISLAVINASADGSEAPVGPLRGRVAYLVRHSGKMAVPAFLYLTMNMLGFVSLKRVDAGTFAVVQQSKIFFTALFSRLFLSRALSLPKWCALLSLVLGVVLISLHANPEFACYSASASPKPTLVAGGPFDYIVGVAAVATDSALSGFATVYFELVLKTTKLTVWDRNLQLAFWSMLIYLPWAVYDHPDNPTHGWSVVTVVVALLGALGGILVALVIKHADGLAKNLATASSIVLTAAGGHFFFGAPMSASIVLGSLVVIVSGFNYQNVS